MIPKKIHYCWFGKGPKSELAIKCINSWKKYLPDYEIMEWNEDNSNYQMCLYAKEAYETGKYAFVSDVIRLHVLYNEGGIYMDTDVELIKPLDFLLEHEAALGFETDEFISTCLMACQKGNELFKEFLQEYQSLHFLKPDGTYNTITNVKRITDICLKYGLMPNNKYQKVRNITIFPKDFFSPKDYYTEKITITKNTYAVHHFSKSWFKESYWEMIKRRNPLLNKIIHIPNILGRLILGKLYDRIKKVIKR